MYNCMTRRESSFIHDEELSRSKLGLYRLGVSAMLSAFSVLFVLAADVGISYR
jgi:hypothetical protein